MTLLDREENDILGFYFVRVKNTTLLDGEEKIILGFCFVDVKNTILLDEIRLKFIQQSVLFDIQFAFSQDNKIDFIQQSTLFDSTLILCAKMHYVQSSKARFLTILDKINGVDQKPCFAYQ